MGDRVGFCVKVRDETCPNYFSPLHSPRPCSLMVLVSCVRESGFLRAEQGKTALALELGTRREISSLALPRRPVKAGPYLAPSLSEIECVYKVGLSVASQNSGSQKQINGFYLCI